MKYLEFAEKLAYEAGEIMENNFRLNMHKEYKKDGSPVTSTDLAINMLVRKRMTEVFPDVALISEESGEDGIRKVEGIAAVVDELDGTIPFSHGIPTFVFSIAFVENGVPFACVVYDPIMKRLFSSTKGGGAFLNGNKISVRTEDKKIMGICWSRNQTNLIRIKEKLISLGITTIELATAVYSGALVSCGEFAASIYPVKFPWDGAAIKILVEEAGGKVTDIFGKEQRYDGYINGCLATNGACHDKLVKLIRETVIQS